MGTIKTTPEALPGQIDARNRAMLRGYAKGALAGAHRGRAIIVRKTPVDQGQLKNSWKIQRGEVQRHFGELAALVNDAPHAAIVEEGARPHKVSQDAFISLYHWCRRKKIGVKDSPRKKRGQPVPEAMIWGVKFTGKEIGPARAAAAIAASFQRKGRKGKHFIKGNLPKLHEAAKDEVLKALDRVAKKGGA